MYVLLLYECVGTFMFGIFCNINCNFLAGDYDDTDDYVDNDNNDVDDDNNDDVNNENDDAEDDNDGDAEDYNNDDDNDNNDEDDIHQNNEDNDNGNGYKNIWQHLQQFHDFIHFCNHEML